MRRARLGGKAVLVCAVAWLVAVAPACKDGASVSASSQSAGRCATVTCDASDACHVPGTCDPSSGRCTAEIAKPCGSGGVCDLSDGQCHQMCTLVACMASDKCHDPGACDPATGLCGLQTSKACGPDQTCDLQDGVCKDNDPCAHVVCAASDLCHDAGTCDPNTGQCSAQTPKSCPSGLGCDSLDGQCKDLCVSVNCPVSDPCHLAGACDPSTGQCSTQTLKLCATNLTCDPGTGQCIDLCAAVTCSGGQSCDHRDGQCRSLLQPLAGKLLGLVAPAAVAFGPDGALYVVGAIVPPTQVFDGIPVTSWGDSDVFLARYGAPTWSAAWALNLGDASLQLATGAAVTQDGTLAVVGNFSGTMTIGSTIGSASQIDFLAGVGGLDGSGKWAKQFNDGTNGALKAVAANPAHGNRIAVCGFASGVMPSDFASGAVPANGNDILIGVFKSDGTRLWTRQIPGAGSGTVNEDCLAVAVDDNGDVHAAGTFSGTSLNFGGSTSALTGPGASTRKYLWVAKFDGGTGAAISSAAFKGTLGSVVPTSLAVDAAGGVAVAGRFTSNVTIGTTLTSVANWDAFVAKLTSALVPAWAVSMGGGAMDVANGVAFDSLGDVIATGQFNWTTSGAATLIAATSTAPDAFLLELGGTSGATMYAAGFGDWDNQSGSAVAVDRLGANEVALVGSLNGSITFPDPAGTITAPVPGEVFLLVATFPP